MTVIEEYIGKFAGSSGMGLYAAAEHIRDVAQSVMDEEKPARIAELRKLIEDGEAAAKELADLKPVGRPREPKRKRAAKEAPDAARGPQNTGVTA